MAWMKTDNGGVRRKEWIDYHSPVFAFVNIPGRPENHNYFCFTDWLKKTMLRSKNSKNHGRESLFFIY